MKITADMAKQLLRYDKDSGELHWLVKPNGRVDAGSRAGHQSKKTGYRVIGIHGRVYVETWIIWLLIHGKFPDGVIDHINGDQSDNRLCNLRDVSQSINMQNQRMPKGSSGFLGVSWDKQRNKWRSTINIDGKNKYLGHFNDAQVAHQVYLQHKRERHIGCSI